MQQTGWIINDAETANLCSLESIFKFYDLKIDKYNTKTTCPFKFHKGGKEHTASFYFYPKTNTYWCFGCKTGSTPVDFVKNYENISFSNAIERILSINNAKFVKTKKKENQDEDYFQLCLKFSDLIREKKDYKNMKIYDDLIEEYNLDENGMIVILKKLIKSMEG